MAIPTSGPAPPGAAPRSPSQLQRADGSPIRVLIVEDEALVALDVADMVERMGGTVLTTVETEDDALAAFAASRPDVVLMDIRLRSGDGLSAARRLRETGPAAIVFVTASTDRETRRRMDAFAGAPVVSKPLRARDLLAGILAAERARLAGAPGLADGSMGGD